MHSPNFILFFLGGGHCTTNKIYSPTSTTYLNPLKKKFKNCRFRVLEKTSESENRLVPGISKESKSKNQPVPGILKKYHFLGISKPLKEPPVFRKELQGPPVKAACIAIIQAASVA